MVTRLHTPSEPAPRAGSSTSFGARHRRALPALLGIAALGFAALQLAVPSLLYPAALAAFLLGIPHGSVERDPTGPLLRGRALPPSLLYSALYVVFAILVMASWLISPWPTLIIALALSAWHFAQSPGEPVGVGVFVVLACFASFPGTTLELFSALTGQPFAAPETWLRVLGGIGLAALWLSPSWRRDWAARLVLTGAFLVIHPVAAVATYFLAWHSLGEVAALLDQRRPGEAAWRTALRTYAPTSLPALFGATALLVLTWHGYVPVPMAAGLAIAFIVPHMLPVEGLLRVERTQSR